MKSMKKKGWDKTINSPVAKFLNDVTTCAVHRDRKNDYKRKPKHNKGWE
jgi:hypothetical protein